jgi:hypothetical protein
MRRALRQRAGKLSQAKEAIDAKQKEVERILQQRQTIVAARTELQDREKKLASKAGKSRGLAALFLGVIAVLGLGVMSWAVVDRIFPATYAASATLAADDSAGALNAEQQEAWMAYVEQLANDPRLMEVASNRMRRRGMIDLGSAGALSARLAQDLDLSSSSPGQLTLTLKGEGADRTQRLLDTFVASMVSVANDARDRRMDGASTIVAVGATVDGEPIQDPRLIYAGIGWGASTGILFFLSIALLVRLTIAKRKFEQENAQMLAVGGPNYAS